ncbi:hypothetical protein SLEP1_g37035 [Rubroshorea leprosula]|uniref:Pentatricopeptide repeat-containing protein n=1 Tax=Rubroshorea leprosula TaxID=152421 RepID=A0AAV5KTC8_9ROSI|nr:hypothetical protein SLEP1_g37035 [Rubroshorea leprosula]
MAVETIVSLLHHCAKIKAFRYGFSLHGAVVKTGIEYDVYVSNHVLNMYAKCGKINFARQVFDEMPEKNVVSWSAMISGYDQGGEPLLALDLFSQMHLVFNGQSFASAIRACGSLMALVTGQQIHARSLKYGYACLSFVSNSLVSMYMKCGYCSDALLVFAGSSGADPVAYNALITGFIENQQPERGFKVFKLMQRQGLVPDHFTFAGLLTSCAESENLHRAMVLHCQTIKLKLDSTPFIGNLMIKMYSKFNLIQEAEKIFRQIEEKDVFSWNTFIAACSHCEDYEMSLRTFGEMLNEHSVRPDDFTFASVFSACAGFASIHSGKEIHAHLIKTRLNQDVGVGNALINMYVKCGSIKYANSVFNKMIHLNLVSWNTIIFGFGDHGLGSRAFELFERMKAIGLKPDSVTFLGLLMACNHAGLVDKCLGLFNSMKETYGIAPNIEHLKCLIDLLGRAGRLTEAKEYMKKFPFGQDPVVLRSLHSACQL